MDNFYGTSLPVSYQKIYNNHMRHSWYCRIYVCEPNFLLTNLYLAINFNTLWKYRQLIKLKVKIV